MQVSFVIALTMPASTFAVVLTTEQEAGVSEVAVTFATREFGTLKYEFRGDFARASKFINSLESLDASPLA